MRGFSTLALACASGAACALLFLAGPARADLLRCVGPGGKMIYTDDKSVCPGAKPFEPKGEIQIQTRTSPAAAEGETAEDAFASRRRRAEQRRRAAEIEESEAQSWRDKKSDLEKSLEKTHERRLYFEKFLTLCNRGGSVITRDESGIKRTVKCSSIRKQHASLSKDEDRTKSKLDGLPEACRRAGCQPGWIR